MVGGMINKMKIAFIASNSQHNGANLSLIKLASLLQEKKDDVIIIYPNKGVIQKECIKEKVPYKVIYGLNWVYKLEVKKKNKYLIKFILMKLINIFSEARIYFYLSKNKFDIVHINTLSIGRGAKSAIKLNIPLVWHIREFMEEDLNHSIYEKQKAYNLIKKSNAIIAVSDSVKDKYESILDTKIFRIYNGIDISKFYNQNKILYANKDIKFAMVGTINENKGHSFLIDCFLTCIEDGMTNISLDIYGEGDKVYVDSLKRRVEKFSSKINFNGYCENIHRLLEDIDVLFVTSKQEAFGRVTVEGQLAGCLVIGINSGGTAELLCEGKGLLVSMNKNEFIQCIKTAVNDKEKCYDIAKTGQEFALTLSAEKNAGDILDVYKFLLTE